MFDIGFSCHAEGQCTSKQQSLLHLANVPGVTMSDICLDNITNRNINKYQLCEIFKKLMAGGKTDTSTPRKSANGIKAMSNDNML